MVENQFKISEFAKKAGVTIRALRHYDAEGLLQPEKRTQSGQKLYSEHDFARLQQILTLKFLGLSLSEIKQLLTNDPTELLAILQKQKIVLENKLLQLKTVVKTIEKAEDTIKNTHTLDWQQFVEIIKAVNMTNQFDWFNQFYTDEQKRQLAERAKSWTLEDQKKAAADWEALFADIRINMDKDLHSHEVQALVDRWQDLINQFTQGDVGIASSLNNAYANMQSAPKEIQEWGKGMKEPSEFIQKALAARKKA